MRGKVVTVPRLMGGYKGISMIHRQNATPYRKRPGSETSRIMSEKDRLAKEVERQASHIDALTAALGDAQARIDEQERRIARLKSEVNTEREARAGL